VLRSAEALHRLGSSDGAERVRAMTEHSRHSVRAFATRLLGQVGEKMDIPRLERLYQSRFLDVRFAAVASLARLGESKRIGVLMEVLGMPDHPELLSPAPGEPSYEKQFGAPAVPAPELRLMAARELAETGYRPALADLGNRLKKATDPMERATVAAAMVRIQSEGEAWRSRILADEKPPVFNADIPGRVPTAP